MLEGIRSYTTIRGWWIWLLAAVLALAGAYALSRRSGETAHAGRAAAGARPTPVTTATVKTGDIGVYVTGLGTVTPRSTVTVKSRVDGQLMKVRFQEGQIVQAGDLLAEIDPRPFQAALAQAEGQLAKDRALLQNAKIDLQRYQQLREQDSIAGQQVDTQASLVNQYEAAIQADQGVVDNARLQVTYSRVTAPTSGRLGLRLVDAGNIVHASDTTGIVVITQLHPIDVVFSIPEDRLPAVLQKLRAGDSLEVEAYDREQRTKLATGKLLSIDNQIDPTTGTVRLKAEFSNDDGSLFPNQFVNARLLVDLKQGSTLVPMAAVQRSPDGTFAYVVKEDKTVEMRPVRVGVTEGDAAAIDEGLAPGETVVVDGADSLRDGGAVEPHERHKKEAQPDAS